MDKKSFFVVFALFVVFLLVSGASCPLPTKKPTGKEAENALKYGTNIYSGSEGLVVDFAKDVPPNRVYSGEPLTVAFDVYNRGAKSVSGEEARLYISGADPNIVQFSETSKPLDVLGKGEVLGTGGFTTVSFDSSEVVLPQGTDVYKPKFIGTVCYSYETVASPLVCLDPNPYGSFTGDKACKITDFALAGGQGAPVAVTRVEQFPTKGQTQLKIYVKNLGSKGKVISSEKLSTCTRVEAQDYNFVNRIDSYEVRIGDNVLSDCSPVSVRLVNNEGVIICRYVFDDASVQAFSTPVIIKLDYGYVESTLPREVDILNIGQTS